MFILHFSYSLLLAFPLLSTKACSLQSNPLQSLAWLCLPLVPRTNTKLCNIAIVDYMPLYSIVNIFLHLHLFQARLHLHLTKRFCSFVLSVPILFIFSFSFLILPMSYFLCHQLSRALMSLFLHLELSLFSSPFISISPKDSSTGIYNPWGNYTWSGTYKTWNLMNFWISEFCCQMLWISQECGDSKFALTLIHSLGSLQLVIYLDYFVYYVTIVYVLTAWIYI